MTDGFGFDFDIEKSFEAAGTLQHSFGIEGIALRPVFDPWNPDIVTENIFTIICKPGYGYNNVHVSIPRPGVLSIITDNGPGKMRGVQTAKFPPENFDAEQMRVSPAPEGLIVALPRSEENIDRQKLGSTSDGDFDVSELTDYDPDQDDGDGDVPAAEPVPC